MTRAENYRRKSHWIALCYNSRQLLVSQSASRTVSRFAMTFDMNPLLFIEVSRGLISRLQGYQGSVSLDGVDADKDTVGQQS